MSCGNYGKKNMTITKKEHDEWHRKHGGYEKDSKEHRECHKKCGIIIKRKVK